MAPLKGCSQVGAVGVRIGGVDFKAQPVEKGKPQQRDATGVDTHEDHDNEDEGPVACRGAIHGRVVPKKMQPEEMVAVEGLKKKKKK